MAAPSDPAVGGEVDGSAGEAMVVDGLNGELKRCLVDSFYGTEFGLRASSETRAEVLELVNQLEAKNPTPAPTEAAALLGGKWMLLYVLTSPLLPYLFMVLLIDINVSVRFKCGVVCDWNMGLSIVVG